MDCLIILMQSFDFDQVCQCLAGASKVTFKKNIARLTTFICTNASGLPKITSSKFHHCLLETYRAPTNIWMPFLKAKSIPSVNYER